MSEDNGSGPKEQSDGISVGIRMLKGHSGITDADIIGAIGSDAYLALMNNHYHRVTVLMLQEIAELAGLDLIINFREHEEEINDGPSG